MMECLQITIQIKIKTQQDLSQFQCNYKTGRTTGEQATVVYQLNFRFSKIVISLYLINITFLGSLVSH